MKKTLSFFCVFLIRFYKIFLSAHLGGACRFKPSCSSYAEQAFTYYNPLKATLLTLKRLAKCHFFGPFGENEPEEGHLKKIVSVN